MPNSNDLGETPHTNVKICGLGRVMDKATENKSLPTRLGDRLQQPGSWSALLSLGIHGVIFLLLPILPFAAREISEPEVRRPVGLVELTPEEQSRLPNFSTPVPAIPNAPPSDDLFSFSPFPSPQPFEPPQPLPPLNFPPAPPLLFPFPNPYTPPPAPSPPATPATPSPQAQSPASPVPSPQPSTPGASPSPDPDRPNSVTDGIPSVAANPNAPSLPNPIPERSPTSTPSATPSPAPTPDQQQALLQEQREMRQLYAYSEEGTDLANTQVRETVTAWYQTAAAWIGDEQTLETEPIEPISGDYPAPACIRRLSGTAYVGVLVDAEGQAVEEPAPELLVSSGYGVFNQRAMEAIASYEFEATGDREAYLVPVEFQPNQEVCRSRPQPSPDASPSATPSPSAPSSAPSPSAAPSSS